MCSRDCGGSTRQTIGSDRRGQCEHIRDSGGEYDERCGGKPLPCAQIAHRRRLQQRGQHRPYEHVQRDRGGRLRPPVPPPPHSPILDGLDSEVSDDGRSDVAEGPHRELRGDESRGESSERGQPKHTAHCSKLRQPAQLRA
eukprot:scaffold245824_cov33-Tisochrysis_lutea.AAC.6